MLINTYESVNTQPIIDQLSTASWSSVGLAPVVQRLDNAIHWINVNKTNHAISWIVIYPVDSAIQPLNNWAWCRPNLHRSRCQPSVDWDVNWVVDKCQFRVDQGYRSTLNSRGTYHLHGKTGNFSWKITWFASFRLGIFREHGLRFEVILFFCSLKSL